MFVLIENNTFYSYFQGILTSWEKKKYNSVFPWQFAVYSEMTLITSLSPSSHGMCTVPRLKNAVPFRKEGNIVDMETLRTFAYSNKILRLLPIPET